MWTKQIVRRAAMVTTASKALAEAMQHHGLKNHHYELLPNVVDTLLFKPLIQALKYRKAERIFPCFL